MSNTEISSSFSALAASAVEDALAFGEHLTKQYGPDPEPGSQADVDLHHGTHRGADGKPWPKAAALRPYDVAGGLITLAVGQYLASLKLLLAPEMALFGFQAVSRSAVEGAARAAWVLDPDIDGRQRVVRGSLLELESVSESGLVERAQSAGDSHHQAQMLDIRARMALLGIDEKLDKNGRLIGFDGLVLPTKTAAVTGIMPHLGLSFGELWYRTMSGISHSALYAVVTYLRADRIDGSGRARPVPELPVYAVVNAAVISVDAYLLTIQRHATLWGRDAASIAGRRLEVKGRLLGAAGSAPPGIV